MWNVKCLVMKVKSVKYHKIIKIVCDIFVDHREVLSFVSVCAKMSD